MTKFSAGKTNKDIFYDYYFSYFYLNLTPLMSTTLMCYTTRTSLVAGSGWALCNSTALLMVHSNIGAPGSHIYNIEAGTNGKNTHAYEQKIEQRTEMEFMMMKAA